MGQCGANVSFTIPDPTDNCPGVSSAPNITSGSFFSAGTTTPITVTATDAIGNTYTCTFTVTVNDIEKPIANCPADITLNNDAGQCRANVGFTIPDPTDNCPGVTAVPDIPSGSFFNVGTTNVRVTATDAVGNTRDCTFNVIINDSETPSITCPSDITVSTDVGQCNVVVDYSLPNVNDNCTVIGSDVNCIDINQFTFSQNDLIVPTVYRGFYFRACEDGVISNISIQIGGQGNGNVNTVFIYSGQSGCGAPIATKTGVTFTPNSVNTIDLTTGITGSTQVVSGEYYHIMIRPVSGFFRIALATGNPYNTAEFGGLYSFLPVSNPIPCAQNAITPMANVNIAPSEAVLTSGMGSGATFTVGTHIESYSVTDLAGNTDQCSFTVTVNETEKPTANCPTNITQSTDAGQCGANVSFMIPDPDDNCPGASSIASPVSGSFFDIGTTQVTVTATDAAGNTNACTFDVTH